MKHSNNHTNKTATTGVPSFIEFTSQNDTMDYKANNECDLLAEDDYDFDDDSKVEEDAGHQEKVATRQELDAMKRMVSEMVQNQELLHQSPVYSNSVFSCYNSATPFVPKNRCHQSSVKAQVSLSQGVSSQAMTALQADSAGVVVTSTTQKASPYIIVKNAVLQCE